MSTKVGKRRAYTPALRLKAIEMAAKKGASATARRLDIPSATIVRWLRAAKSAAVPHRSPSRTSGDHAVQLKNMAAEIKRLRAEVADLRAQREVLRRAVIDFARRAK